jgi:RHS repeat-associated protein
MRNSFTKICLFLIIFIFQFLTFNQVYAEELGPGWFMGNAKPVSPEAADAYYNSQQLKKLSQLAILSQSVSENTSQAVSALASSATTATNEIKELARALQYDPKLIYDYVHNNIDYVPYFGSLKGATLTYLDGSGNDFDQASLMIALLRESSSYNFSIETVQYVYGTLRIYPNDISNWLGVNNNINAVVNLLYQGGIPVQQYVLGDGSFAYVEMSRVWVKAILGGLAYVFDPAFKSYQYTSKIDIGQAMLYNQSELITAAGTGATLGIDYVKNLNEGNLNNKLSTYSSNLVNVIRSQYPNKDLKDIIGGRSIIQTNLQQYPTSLPFTIVSQQSPWDDIPDDKTAKLILRHGPVSLKDNFCKISNPDLTSVNIIQEYYIPEIAGKRLTLTHSGSNIPKLKLDGILVQDGIATTVDKAFCIIVDHPYAGINVDQAASYIVKNDATYAIVSDFGGTNDSLLMKRQKQLDVYLDQGLADTSEQVRGETLNIMGLTWMKENVLTDRLLGSLADNVAFIHHRIGLMAQETGYYIDVKNAVMGIGSKSGNSDDMKNHFKVSGLITSAFEHTILEQLMGSDNPGVSTMKLFKIANSNTTNNIIFYADSSNFSTGSKIKDQLVNYTTSGTNNDIDKFQGLVNAGYSLILPQNGKLCVNPLCPVDKWKGKGYLAKAFTDTYWSMEMAIGGGYLGGYASNTGYIQPPIVNSTVSNQVYNSYSPVTIRDQVTTIVTPTTCKPVDMASGAEVYESADIALGGTAPMGLSFGRYFNSGLNYTKKYIGYGWTHNYDIYLERNSDGNPGLGKRQPVDAASMISSLYVMLDIIKSKDTDSTSKQDKILGWMVSSLTSKWAVDQLISTDTVDNAVTVHLGSKVMEFIRLSDGTYSPPPGITTQLIKNVDSTYSLKERFGTKMDFNTSNKISQLTDVDGNAMTFTYTGNKLTSVKDAFNRTFTLQYDASNRIIKVTDSAGRFVSYGYDANKDLTTYTDTELKTWSYGYDVNHRITTFKNPLLTTITTNEYDSMGRVNKQTFPRQSGTAAVHNFYFSGYRNIEETGGGSTIYYFDEQGRNIKVEDALSNKSTKVYDGQNHVIQTTDPGQNSTTFQYDGNQNLTKVTNALGKEVKYTYDSQFHLTDTIDPLNHGTHFDYDPEHHPTVTKSCNYTGTTCIPVTAGDGKEIKSSAMYYTNGLTETTTDAKGTVATLTYDAYGNPDTTKVGSHAAVDFTYDPIGRMTGLTDQVSSTTSFVYDKRNLLTKKTDPLLKDTILTYDNAGRLATRKDRNNQTITYSYTPTDKLDTITYPDASTVHLTYDQYDQLTGMQEAIGNSIYGYDAVGRLISQTDANGFAVAYGYDAAGNLTSITYPGNKTVSYTYDALNRLKTVKINWLNQTATYYYDDAGRLDYLVNFNGTITDYSYDNANRLAALDNKKSDNTTILASYSFTLDAKGNRTNVVQNEPLTSTPNTANVSYTYNTKKNRLLTAGADSFGYDNEGQLATKASATYTFDLEHRLKSIAGTTTFYYDGSGKRVKAVRGGAETRYVYDAGGNLLAEADANNIITKYYIHGLGLIAMVTPANAVYTYHFNAVGSTIAMTDSSQAMVNKYSYDPFGNVLNQQEGISQPFKFIGEFGVMTEPNGFYYMRARYYDPQVGRFVSEDPIGFDGGDVNLMVYVSNNPILMIDPFGLEVLYKGGEIKNPLLRQKLQMLNDMLPGSDIIVTGGDRYRDSSGNIRETLNNKLVKESAIDSAHLSGHAADFYISNMSLDPSVLKDLGFDWTKYYNDDGHIHSDIRKSGAYCAQ